MARTIANEKGTQQFLVEVLDMAGAPVVPTAFTWSLTDENGVIINSREDVSETPAASVTITLFGDDLQIIDSSKRTETRYLTVETDMGDAGLPWKEEKEFFVKNLKKVT